MTFASHRLHLLAPCLLAASFGLNARASAQTAELPESLVLRFEEGTAELDQAAIRDAVAAELGIPLALEGSEQAATLWIGRAPSGDVRVSYRPARDELTRSLPVTARSDVPELIAHLAGNLVRSEARELLAELTPAVSAPPVATTPPAPPPPTVQAAAPADEVPPYFDNAWIFSALGGGVLRGDEQLQLSLQLSRRVGRFEFAAGARLGYGRADADVSVASDVSEVDRVSTYQVTLPLSAEFRVLGRDEAYLQLGGYVGYRLAGIMNQSESVASGSDGDVAYGFQATMGFRLAQTHGLMLRLVWELGPETHSISSSDANYDVDALAPIAQVGWQIGW